MAKFPIIGPNSRLLEMGALQDATRNEILTYMRRNLGVDTATNPSPQSGLTASAPSFSSITSTVAAPKPKGLAPPPLSAQPEVMSDDEFRVPYTDRTLLHPQSWLSQNLPSRATGGGSMQWAVEAPSGFRSDLGQMISNVPESAGNFATALVRPITHPRETAESFYHLGKGLVELAFPGEQENEQYVQAVGQFFRDRYGSIAAVRRTIIKDPIGFAADVATIFTLGGAAAARIPGVVGQMGEALRTAGQVMDPLFLPLQSGKAVVREAADTVEKFGGPSMREAYTAGQRGGVAAEEWTSNIRGETAPEAAVAEAREANLMMRDERLRQYRQQSEGNGTDKPFLDTKPIADALKMAAKTGTSKEHTFKKTADMAAELKELRELILDAASRPRTPLRTPEAVDALRQTIKERRDSAPTGSLINMMAEKVYRAVDNVLETQAPVYAKAVKDYDTAEDLIHQIKSERAMNSDANVNAPLRELYAIIRSHKKELPEFFAETLLPALAGQSMRSWEPGTGPLTQLLAPAISPRALGEGAFAAGRLSNVAPAAALGQGGYQLGRIPLPGESPYISDTLVRRLHPMSDAFSRLAAKLLYSNASTAVALR